MNLRLKRTPGVYVVGFMLSGKSTVGRLLAHRLGWSFFDLDDEITAAEKATIQELLDRRGEPELRRIESQLLCQHVGWIERGRPAVLALGEDCFAGPANRELLLAHGIVVWLDCPWETIERRLVQSPHRPAACGPGELRRLYEQRLTDFANADVRIPIEGEDASAVADAILRHPVFQ